MVKILIVIDPIRTEIAKSADIFLQIKPRMDFYLAIILARFIIMQNGEDREFLDNWGSEYEDFYDFSVREFRIKPILEHIGIELNILGDIVESIIGKKVVFLVGNGVQKYSIGNFVLHAIDSLATILGLFGKEGSGVAFIGNSKLGIDNPFDVDTKKSSKSHYQKFQLKFLRTGS